MAYDPMTDGLDVTPENIVDVMEYLAGELKPYTADGLREAVKEISLEEAIRECAASMSILVALPKFLTSLNDFDRAKLILALSALSQPLQVAFAYIDPEIAYECAAEGEKKSAERKAARDDEIPEPQEIA